MENCQHPAFSGPVHLHIVKQGRILGSKIKAKSQGHRAEEMAQWLSVRTLLADDQSWFPAAHNCL